MNQKIEDNIQIAFRALKERNMRNLGKYVEIRGEKYFFKEWVHLIEKKQELTANGLWQDEIQKMYCKYISHITHF